MRKGTAVWIALAALMVTVGLLGACSAPVEEEATTEPAPTDGGAALLQERCTVCHPLDRVTRAQKTREEWERTVDRMVGRGAELNEEEQSILIEYLTETYGP
ncbi:MAG: hypothetical protein PVH62_03075 [Anaerolineae bacterium]|jgi:cytochrome c5